MNLLKNLPSYTSHVHNLLDSFLAALLFIPVLWTVPCFCFAGQKVCYGAFKHSCYKLAYFQDLSRRVGFQEARQACEIDGGALLSLESEAEQQLIENMLQNLTRSGSGISDGDFWIGLWRSGDGVATSSACPDLYQWADGSKSPFRWGCEKTALLGKFHGREWSLKCQALPEGMKFVASSPWLLQMKGGWQSEFWIWSYDRVALCGFSLQISLFPPTEFASAMMFAGCSATHRVFAAWSERRQVNSARLWPPQIRETATK